MLSAYRVMVAVMLAGASAFASAQAYPTRPIRLGGAYPAGGGGDRAARPLAQKRTETIGRPRSTANHGGLLTHAIAGGDAAARAPTPQLRRSTPEFAYN